MILSEWGFRSMEPIEEGEPTVPKGHVHLTDIGLTVAHTTAISKTGEKGYVGSLSCLLHK